MKFFSKKNSNKGGFVKLDQPTTGNDANVKPSKKPLLALHTARSLRLLEKRQQPSPSVVDEEQMRGTIGIRQQKRLSRDQALYVASCNAHHRDLSLNF